MHGVSFSDVHDACEFSGEDDFFFFGGVHVCMLGEVSRVA